MSTKYAVRIQASRLKPLAALIPLLIAVGHAGAVGVGQIAAGSGTISSNVATTGSNGATTINQQSNRLVVNWSNFDVATGERVQINQPNAQSAILNRVNSASRTQIDGALSANGRIFVVNPNGIVVGKTGTINANGVVLSTLDVPDSFFIKSEGGSGPTLLPFRKVAGAANAAVVNEGTINAGVAGVNLFGSQVINGATGKISAKGDRTVTAGALTSVNMVASDMVEAYQTDSTGGLVAYIPFGNLNAIAVDGLVANDGAIEVDAGNVDLNIYGGRSTLSEALRNTGSIKASSVDAEFPGVPGLHTIGGNVSLRSRGVGTHVGGSISGKNVTIATQNNTVVDGTLDAVANLDVAAVSVNKDATLVVSDNGRLDSGGYLSLVGDNVMMNGRATSGTAVRVVGYGRADVREGGLNAPNWTIDNGGKVTTGTGQNGLSSDPVAQGYSSTGDGYYGNKRPATPQIPTVAGLNQ